MDNTNNMKQVLIESGRKMLGRGLTVETWGNISLRDPRTGRIYLTPSGMDYSTLTEEDVVVFDADGHHVEGSRTPSMEKEMHLGILAKRPDVNAVIHTHPIYSQVFAVLGMPIPAIIDESAQVFGGDVLVAKYGLPGSRELADHVIQALGAENNACLMANHGAVCVGGTIDMAFRCCTVLEMTAQIYQMCLQIGKPNIIDPEQIAIMKNLAKNYFNRK